MKLTKVTLHGPLRKLFGAEFEFMAGSVRDITAALTTQVPGYKKFMMQAESRGMRFAVFSGDRNLSADQLEDPNGGNVVRIIPIIQGNKRQGVLQTIIGIVLIVVGAYMGNAAIIKFGVSLVIGGISQMLAPQPKGLGAKDDVQNTPSLSFNGPVNTQAQGNPVPVAYGQCWAGSAIISGGIYAEDQQ